MQMVGRVAFYIGLAISIVAGWIDVGTTGSLVLVILGFAVGLLNVTGKEASRFLLATLVLLAAGMALGGVFGESVGKALGAYVAFTAGAAIVVALKEVYSIERD